MSDDVDAVNAALSHENGDKTAFVRYQALKTAGVDDAGLLNSAISYANGDKTALARHYALKTLQNK